LLTGFEEKCMHWNEGMLEIQKQFDWKSQYAIIPLKFRFSAFENCLCFHFFTEIWFGFYNLMKYYAFRICLEPGGLILGLLKGLNPGLFKRRLSYTLRRWWTSQLWSRSNPELFHFDLRPHFPSHHQEFCNIRVG